MSCLMEEWNLKDRQKAVLFSFVLLLALVVDRQYTKSFFHHQDIPLSLRRCFLLCLTTDHWLLFCSVLPLRYFQFIRVGEVRDLRIVLI